MAHRGPPSQAPDEDLYEGNSPQPSAEGLPPFDARNRPVRGYEPRPYCPRCARVSCPLRTLDVPRLPTGIELEWEHPIRGLALRNRLSRWLLASTVVGSLAIWVAVAWFAVQR